ncbi:MAG: SAM-dependent methyltransferase, partial [Pseudomonadota bacterium]|nr:SAM-dependent methyltransferase [Pseudomonadota bacterium]
MTRPWLSVIGLGPEGEAGLTAGALAALGEATHVVCAERHAGLLPEALLAGKTIHHWPAWHQAEAVLRPLEGQSVAVLGTGEPFHFGVGTSLVRWFGIGALRVFPASSAFDRACARLGLSQQTTPCLSAYGRSLGAVLLQARPGRTMLVLGDGELGLRLGPALTAMGLGASSLTALSQMDGAGESRLDARAARGRRRRRPRPLADRGVVRASGALGPRGRRRGSRGS